MRRDSLAGMRVAWTAGALLALLRRWSAFLLVSMAVLGLGYFAAAIGWPALPALWASSLPPLPGAAVLLLHASIAVALAWGLREALQPQHWLQAERALPLGRWQRSGADLLVVALAQSPLLLLYGASLLSWRLQDPEWLRGHWGRGLGFMAASVLLSLLGAAGLLAWRRRPPRVRAPAAASNRPARRPRGRWMALIVLPLWRGPARPVAGALLLGSIGLLMLVLLAGLWPAQLRWFLAGYAFVALYACQRVHALALRCYAPLIEASRGLPLAPQAWPRRLRALALLPVALSWPPLVALLLAGPWALSPRVAPLYLLAAWLGPALQTDGAAAPSAKLAENRAARWLLTLVAWIALATEILR